MYEERTVFEFLESLKNNEVLSEICDEFDRLNKLRYQAESERDRLQVAVYAAIQDRNKYKARLELNGISTE